MLYQQNQGRQRISTTLEWGMHYYQIPQFPLSVHKQWYSFIFKSSDERKYPRIMCNGHEETNCWHWQHSVEAALIAPAFTSVLLFDSVTQMAFPALPQLAPLSQELP